MTSLARLRDPRIIKVALAAVATAYVITHIAAVFTDTIHWDELAQYHRAQHALLTGELQAGGRPGLGVIAVIPFARDCEDPIAVAISGRLLWCGFTFALLAGLFFFLRGACRRSPAAWHAAALGTAALGLVPLFLRWSLQVRTDQPAVAASLWAGVAVLASRERWPFATLAGALLALGYLFSQKAIYIGALVGVVTLGDLYIEGVIHWRRELRRMAALVVGAVAVVGVYKLAVPVFFTPPRTVALDAGLNLFDWYRRLLRYRLYPSILTSVLPHIGLLVLILFAATRAFSRRDAERKPLLVALVVMILGYAVARFHTASFPYFWSTIGVFPATAIALGWPGIRARFPRAHVWMAIAAWVMMIALAVRYRAETLEDTQRTQRATFAFLERDVPWMWRGFQADGALMCRRDGDPFPVYFSEHIQQRLYGPDPTASRLAFIDEFRKRPVSFLVRTQRLNGFPSEVKDFWKAHYVPYSAAVEVAGAHVQGTANSRVEIDIIVAGSYRWRGPASIAIDGRDVARGGTIALAPGTHEIAMSSDIGDGTLVLDLPDAPPPSVVPFYSVRAHSELGGVRYDWW